MTTFVVIVVVVVVVFVCFWCESLVAFVVIAADFFVIVVVVAVCRVQRVNRRESDKSRPTGTSMRTWRFKSKCGMSKPKIPNPSIRIWRNPFDHVT